MMAASRVMLSNIQVHYIGHSGVTENGGMQLLFK